MEELRRAALAVCITLGKRSKKELWKKPCLSVLRSKSYGGELHFLAEFFWVVDSSPVNERMAFHVFGEVFWFEFLEFVPFCY